MKWFEAGGSLAGNDSHDSRSTMSSTSGGGTLFKHAVVGWRGASFDWGDWGCALASCFLVSRSLLFAIVCLSMRGHSLRVSS